MTDDERRPGKPTRKIPAMYAWTLTASAFLVAVAALNVATRGQRAWLDDVTVYSYRGGIHVTRPVDYAQSPAVGGPHHPVWQNCGVYRSPLRQEHVVHSLEHGAISITYRPDLVDVEERARLTANLPGAYVIVSPYPQQTAAVVASAWNHQLLLDSVDDERLKRFVDTFRNGRQAPEPGAPCDGGTDDTAAP